MPPTPKTSTSTKTTPRYKHIARMTSGAGIHTRQRHLDWRFDEKQGIIIHRDLEHEGEDSDDACDACSQYDAHYSLRNGKAGSLNEATLARDRWFRQNLVPFSDSVEQQELVAKTQELERVRRELSGKCCEAERLRTALKVAEDALENEQEQRADVCNELSQLKCQCRADGKERTRLFNALKDEEAKREVSAEKISELQAERIRRRDNFAAARRKLDDTQRELDTTRRELNATRRELEDARREIVQMRLPPPGHVEGASTSSAVPYDEVWVLSP